jgi:hypothetical protein
MIVDDGTLILILPTDQYYSLTIYQTIDVYHRLCAYTNNIRSHWGAISGGRGWGFNYTRVLGALCSRSASRDVLDLRASEFRARVCACERTPGPLRRRAAQRGHGRDDGSV